MHALTTPSLPQPQSPYAVADPALAMLGRSLLDGLLGGTELAALEAAKRPRHIEHAHLADAPSSATLWDLAASGRINFDEDEIRVVARRPDGLAVVPPELWTRRSGGGGTAFRTPDAASLRALFARGATIAFQRLDRYHPPLARVAAALSAVTGHPVQCSAYLSPGHGSGLDVHHDTHDVLALQIEGTKRFRLFGTIVADPVPKIDLTAEQAAAAEPIGDIELTPGTALYVPRGVPHCAVAGSGHSLHLTIGFLVQAWATLIEPLARELYYLEPLRRAIAASDLFDPDTLRGDAELAIEQVIAWLRAFGAERIAALACEHFVASFANRPAWPDMPVPPAMSYEPAPDGGTVMVTPDGRVRRPSIAGALL